MQLTSHMLPFIAYKLPLTAHDLCPSFPHCKPRGENFVKRFCSKRFKDHTHMAIILKQNGELFVSILWFFFEK